MGNNQSTGLRHRGGHGRHIQRRNRAQINHLNRAAILNRGLRGCQGHRNQRTVRNNRGVGTLAHDLGAKRVEGGVIQVHVPLEPVAALGLKDNDRIRALNRLAGHPIGLVRARGSHDAQAGGVGEQRLGRLGVVLHRANHAAVGNTNRHRHDVLLIGAVVNLRKLARDLVEGGENEAVELNLGNGAVPAQRHADGGADNAGLPQRAIHDAAVAEAGLQALGHAVHAAKLADILTEQNHGAVSLQGILQAASNGLGEGQTLNVFAHLYSSSKPAL